MTKNRELSLIYDVIVEALSKHGRIRTMFRGRSMLPTLREGMSILIKKSSPQDVKSADIIMYKSANNMVVHRVIRVIKKGNDVVFVTKGDNHAYIDCSYIPASDLIGIVRGAFFEDSPTQDVLVRNRLAGLLYVAVGNLALFARENRMHIPVAIRNILKYFVGGFFLGCKKIIHGMHHKSHVASKRVTRHKVTSCESQAVSHKCTSHKSQVYLCACDIMTL